MTFIIAQGLGIVATLCFLFSFQVRTNNAGIIRLANMFICSPTWIIYDILTGAYSAIANEVVVIGSVILSIYRYGMKELLDPESEFQKGGSK